MMGMMNTEIIDSLSKEMTIKFIQSFHGKVMGFIREESLKLDEKNLEALSSLVQANDEYSDMIFNDYIKRFLTENKGVEMQIAKEIGAM
jgi:hypothetical protein